MVRVLVTSCERGPQEANYAPTCELDRLLVVGELLELRVAVRVDEADGEQLGRTFSVIFILLLFLSHCLVGFGGRRLVNGVVGGRVFTVLDTFEEKSLLNIWL